MNTKPRFGYRKWASSRQADLKAARRRRILTANAQDVRQQALEDPISIRVIQAVKKLLLPAINVLTMSSFFISGFAGLSSDGSNPSDPLGTSVVSGGQDPRQAELFQLAYIELARFEFGIMDNADGKQTLASKRLKEAQLRSGRLSHVRAKQRAHSYFPMHGSEHCPQCWVFEGVKHALHFKIKDGVESASCHRCDNQIQLALN